METRRGNIKEYSQLWKNDERNSIQSENYETF